MQTLKKGEKEVIKLKGKKKQVKGNGPDLSHLI